MTQFLDHLTNDADVMPELINRLSEVANRS